MNLESFLNYHNTCILCNSKMELSFHSKKIQFHSRKEDQLLIKMNLYSLSRHYKTAQYKIGYDINIKTNDFSINFYHSSDNRYDNYVPINLITKFRSLDKNHGSYRLYNHCSNCMKYMYVSNYLNIDYKLCNLGDIYVSSESALIFDQINDGYKAYKLLNRHDENEGWFEIYNLSNHQLKEFLIDYSKSNTSFKYGSPPILKSRILDLTMTKSEIINHIDLINLLS